MELKFTFLLILICTTLFGQHQQSDVTWDSLYTSAYDEVLHDVKWLRNGNRIIAVGEALTRDSKLQGVFYCVDAVTGQLITRKYFGGLRNDVLLSAAEASNGTFVLVGYTESSSSKNGKDGWMIQLDENFEEIRQVSEKLTSPGDDELKHIIWDTKTNQGIVIGTRKANPPGFLWLLSIPAKGILNYESRSAVGDGIAADVTGMAISREGNLWAFGNTRNSDDSNKGDIWYAQINPNALTSQTYNFRSRFLESIKSGHVTTDNTLLMSGTINNPNGSKNGWALKIDPVFDKPIDRTLEKDHLGNESVETISSDWLGRIFAIAHKPGGLYLLDLDKDLTGTESAMQLDNSSKLEVTRLIKTYGDYFICGGTDRSGKRSGIRLMKTVFKYAMAQKAEPVLLCVNPKFETTDGNDVLTSGEYGSISFFVENTSEEFFSGGKFTVKQEDPDVKGIVITSGTNGYLEYIGGKSMSSPVSIGMRAVDRVEAGDLNLLFKIEGYSGKTCKLHVQIGEQKSGTSYSYNKPAVRNGTSRDVPMADNYVKLEVVVRTNNPNLKKENLRVKLDDLEVSNNKSDTELSGGQLENGQYEYQFEYVVRDVPEGRHKLYIFSDDDNSSSDPIYLNYKGIRPNLHVVAIGPSYENLEYTMKDARDITQALYRQIETDFFGDVFVDTLIGLKADAVAINRLMEQLYNRSQEEYEGIDKIKTNDYLVLFYSGHGTKVNGKFCLQPAGYDQNYKLNTTVRYQEIVNNYLAKTNCKVFILIDACLSGAASKAGDARDLSTLIMEVNKAAPGITSISSCGENESSYEFKMPNGKGNGVFTKALLEAFRFENTKMTNGSTLAVADFKVVRNNAHKRAISIEALETFLKQRVPDIQVQQAGKGRLTQNPKTTIYELHKTLPVYISNN